MNVKLVIAKQTELDEIANLAVITWNEHYPSIVGQQQVDYMLQKMYSASALQEQFAKKGHVFYFIESENERIGFLAVTFDESKPEVFVHKFYILGKKQKAGMGTQVFQLLTAMYPVNCAYRLTVNRQNFKSINFYFKNGFIIEKVADFDIGNGYFMNDFVMLKRPV